MNWAAHNANLPHNGLFEGDGRGTTIVFLGTGAACGVPTWYCDCEACREAQSDPRAQRTCCSLAIVRDEVTLIDAAPELHLQLQRQRICDVDRILFTHEHNDHVGGLPQLEYYSRLRTKRPLELHCNFQTASYLKTHFDFMGDVMHLNEVELGQPLEFDGIRYVPVAAAHCPGALGYVIEIPAACTRDGVARRVAYLPDTSRPCDQTLDVLRGVDVLVLDSTFNGGNWMPTQHLQVADAVALAEELQVERAILTHLSMQFDEPITLAQLEQQLAPTCAEAAYDGLRLEF